ncbi:MAG: hypothetical protein ACO1Q7_15905 [Gemmatimonas sp.]
MSIHDPVQAVLLALIDVVDEDIELQALFGRPDALIIPERSRESWDFWLSVITYSAQVVRSRTGYRQLNLTLTAISSNDDAVCGKAVERLEWMLSTAGITYNLFGAKGLEVAPNHEELPVQMRHGTVSEPDEPVACSAELLCSLLFS